MGANSNTPKSVLFLLFSVVGSFGFGGSSHAGDSIIRWTGSDDSNASIDHVVDKLNERLKTNFTVADFLLQEERDLAFNHYRRYVQVVDHLPVHGKSIRIWTTGKLNETVQVEASVAPSTALSEAFRTLRSSRKSALQLQSQMTPEKTMTLVRQLVQEDSHDPHIRGISWKDEWQNGKVIRFVKVRGKSGYHFIQINLVTGKVSSPSAYREFPQGDLNVEGGGKSEVSIPVQVYPIYEEVEGDGEGKILERVPSELKYILREIPQANPGIYDALKSTHYYDFKFDPILGGTEEGRKEGYWSMAYVKEQASQIRDLLPQAANNWSTGVLLQGRYATINLHPDALTKFGPLNFTPKPAAALYPDWKEATVEGRTVGEMVPSLAYLGKPISSPQEALSRPARRLSDHNPTQYINDGFDEIQVYYAINTLFETLQSRGFVDPEISTRPFNAFLFNPDIAYRDNAFYTDDTINFTTYSSKAGNAARDNSTIWHELGHGVMDRLMGDNIELADTGGLSEGMADFVAAMVIQAVSQGNPFPGSDKFRIINKTGFHLTNEVHDDGEAYGGAMKDFMDAVIREFGPKGLDKVADLVLEGMRLTRDYPGLTASGWFSHLLFADSLGRPGVREKDELKPYLLAALGGRNFRMDGGEVATFSLVNSESHAEVDAGTPGSRDHAIPVTLSQTETADFSLEAKVKNSSGFSFSFPVQIKVLYTGGALEGAVHWVGEENGPQIFTLNSEADVAKIPLRVSGKCDEINRADGSCVDYVYVQVWNQGETKRPVAKKRFYVRVKNP